MPHWLTTYLGSLQGGIVRTLAAEMRAGGLGIAWRAFGLGALYALTPGHGKARSRLIFWPRGAHRQGRPHRPNGCAVERPLWLHGFLGAVSLSSRSAR